MLTAELENHHLLGDAGFWDGRRRQLARDLGGPAEFVLPGLGALVVALLFTGLRGSRRVRTA
jgi:hypothetical protein